MNMAIEVQDLRKSYGNFAAVDGISFAVGKGEIFGLLGPNGAGKTTTLECLEGLRQADGGLLKVMGQSLDPHILWQMGKGLCRPKGRSLRVPGKAAAPSSLNLD